MTPKHHAHLDSIVSRFSESLRAKYTAGQKEHKGKLWQKKHIIDMALEEVLDMAVYLYTLKDQIEELEQSGISLGEIGE